jgi:TolB-like protein/Tfp pilus assembly protein PilF
MGKFFQELRRRNVVRVLGAYLVVGWLLVQVATTLEESMQLPAWFDGVVVGLLIVGLPIALIVSWVFDLTPDGVVRTGAADDNTQYKAWRKLDIVIVMGIVVVGAIFFWQKIRPVEVVELQPAMIETAPGISAATIAVLPFADLSPAGDQEYFSDGISEEILNLLAGIDELDVTSRTSAFQFKGRDLGIPEIASRLEVRHVVEGSVRKAGATLRITAQLIDAEQDKHLWSDTFDRPLTAENVFLIQDEISKAIVGALGNELDFDAIDNMGVRAATDNLTAYESYLKARGHYQSRTQLDVAEELLKAAVEEDPNFADAWAIRAALQFLLQGYGYSDAEQAEIAPLTFEYANNALELEPDNATAIAAMAYVQVRAAFVLDGKQDFAKVLADLSRAIEINPRNASALNWRGLLRLTLGDIPGALIDFKACVDFSPLTAPCAENYVTILAGAGRDDEAFAHFQTMLQAGIVKGRESDLALLARMGEKTAFMALTNDQNVLFGWDEHEALYNALRNTQADNSALAATIREFAEAHPERENLAIPVALAYLDTTYTNTHDDNEVLILWNQAHGRMRQSDSFRDFIRQSGILGYWQQHGFPPQCRAAGANDFECD